MADEAGEDEWDQSLGLNSCWQGTIEGFPPRFSLVPQRYRPLVALV